ELQLLFGGRPGQPEDVVPELQVEAAAACRHRALTQQAQVIVHQVRVDDVEARVLGAYVQPVPAIAHVAFHDAGAHARELRDVVRRAAHVTGGADHQARGQVGQLDPAGHPGVVDGQVGAVAAAAPERRHRRKTAGVEPTDHGGLIAQPGDHLAEQARPQLAPDHGDD